MPRDLVVSIKEGGGAEIKVEGRNRKIQERHRGDSGGEFRREVEVGFGSLLRTRGRLGSEDEEEAKKREQGA